jgi:excinuclease UvrABC nuclease subunit
MKYLTEYKEIIRSLESCKEYEFNSDLKLNAPKSAGIYVATDNKSGKGVPIYVGESKNLRDRIGSKHVSGDKSSARIKKGILDSSRASSWKEARNYLEKYCKVRFVEVPTPRLRILGQYFAIAYYDPEFNK